MKRFLSALVLSAAGLAMVLSGCNMFGPVPAIESFSVDESSVGMFDTVTFTVSGTTFGSGSSSATDYTGTLTVTSDPGTFSKELAIEGDFEETVSAVMNDDGHHTFTATLMASNGDSVKRTVDVSVPVFTHDDDVGNWITTDCVIDPVGDVDWHKFVVDTTPTDQDNAFVLHWQDYVDHRDSSYETEGANVEVTVYDSEGTIIGGPQNAGCFDDGESSGTSGSSDGIKLEKNTHYVDGDNLYVKVEAIANTNYPTGKYAIYLW